MLLLLRDDVEELLRLDSLDRLLVELDDWELREDVLLLLWLDKLLVLDDD